MSKKGFISFCLAIYLFSGAVALAQEWQSWLGQKIDDHPKIADALESLLLQDQPDRLSVNLSRPFPHYDWYRQGDQIRAVIEAASPSVLPGIAAAVRRAGGQVELSHGSQIQALLPLAQLREIADLSDVAFIRPPIRPVSDQGNIVSEGQKIIGAPTWNRAGLNGRGVNVGVIDGNFYQYERQLGKELPPRERVTARSFRSDRQMFDPEFPDGHGIAVAEVVHDVAPGANLNFAAFDTDVEFRQAIDWMIEEKVNVITTSLGFPSGCFRGEGLFEPQIKKARDAGITWVTSAGNRGNRHWEGSFSDKNSNSAHEFADLDESLTIEVEYVKLEELGVAAVLVSLVFSWDGPCTGARDDYDVIIFPESQPQTRFRGDWFWRPGVPVKTVGIVGIIRNPAAAGQRDRIGVQIVRKRADAPPTRLDLVVQACLGCRTIEHVVPQGSVSIYEPASSPNAISVGALHQAPERCPRSLCPTSNLLAYSSRGPTKDGRVKPDIVAPSHVSTATYGRYTGDGPDQNSGFDGTSAAAPHVAGAAALVRQLFPRFSPKELQDFLEGRVEDRGPKGKDNDWGAGQLALGSVVIVPAAPMELRVSSPTPRQIQLSWRDQADNEEGFSIERRFAEDPEYTEIARVVANVTIFTDTAILPETPYCYRVRAFTQTASSDYTNESCSAGLAEMAVREFAAQMQSNVFGRVELPSELRDAFPIGVTFTELPKTTVGERTSDTLSDIGLQLSPSTGAIWGSPAQTGNFRFLLQASIDNRALLQIWALVAIQPAARGQAHEDQANSPPRILFVDFPSQIRADGKPVRGFVGFADPDGDVVKANFTVVSATDLQSFQLAPEIKGRTEGAFAFEIALAAPQRVTLAVTLTDEANQTSSPRELSFEAMAASVLAVSPDRLNQSSLAGVGEPLISTIEVRNTGGGTLFWSALADAPWLQLRPSEGRAGAGEAQRLEVQASKDLQPGRYRALILIRAPGAQGSPKWIRFALELKHAAGTLRWQTQITPTEASPTLAPDGTIYIAADKTLYAVSSDGQTKWAFQAGGPLAATAATLAPNGAIYLGSDDGFLYALSPDGQELWRRSAGAPVRGGPGLGKDGTIYFGTGSDPFENAALYALLPNGTPQFPQPFVVEGGVVASPAIAPDGTVYVATLGGRLYALSPERLTRKWRFSTSDGIASSPAIGADGTVYVASLDGRLYAIAPDGKERWRLPTEKELHSSPAIGPDGTIYLGSLDGHLYAIGSDGQERWRFQMGGPVFSSPAIAADGTIYVGSNDGILYALTAEGKRKWGLKTGGEIRSSPVIAPDGTVYIASKDGLLYAVRGEAGLAQSPWPMLRQNPQRTGRAP